MLHSLGLFLNLCSAKLEPLPPTTPSYHSIGCCSLDPMLHGSRDLSDCAPVPGILYCMQPPYQLDKWSSRPKGATHPAEALQLLVFGKSWTEDFLPGPTFSSFLCTTLVTMCSLVDSQAQAFIPLQASEVYLRTQAHLPFLFIYAPPSLHNSGWNCPAPHLSFLTGSWATWGHCALVVQSSKQCHTRGKAWMARPSHRIRSLILASWAAHAASLSPIALPITQDC